MSVGTEWLLKMRDGVSSTLTKITGLADATSRKFDATQAKIDGMGTKLNGLRSIAVGALGALSVGTIINSSLQAYDQAAQAQGQLQAAFNSTGGTVGRTMDQLLAKSDAMMGVSLFDDDEITKMQSVLLTFNNVKGAIYDQAVPAIADLATRMGTDLQSASLQVGKALQNPIEGMSALKRAGVSFSQSDQERVKKMVEGGNLVAAQQVILTELNKEFGGSAEAAARSGLGPLKVLQNQMGNYIEMFGGFIAGGLLWVIDNGGFVIDTLQSIGIAVAALGVAWFVTGGYLTVATSAMALFNAVVAANPFSLVAIAIAGVVFILAQLWQRSEMVRGGLMGLWEGAKQVFSNIASAAKNYLGGLGDLLIGVFTMDPSKIKSGLSKLGDALKGATVDLGKGVGEKFTAGYVQGAAEVRFKTKQEEAKNKAAGASSKIGTIPSLGGVGGTGTDGAGVGTSDPKTKKGIESVAGGGAQVRNVSINIRSFMENTHFHGVTEAELPKLEEKLNELFVRVLQGGENAIA